MMELSKQTLVVKVGGTEGVDFQLICQDVHDLVQKEFHIVLVHGGSSEANKLGESLGYPPRFVTSPSGFTSRYTDRKTLEIFAMAVNGKVNTLLVEQLQVSGVNAFGLCGLDGRVINAKRKEAIRIIENGKQKMLRDDFTGRIEAVNTDLLNILINHNYVPVIAPLAASEEGVPLNVDADRAAAMIASALHADTLVMLTGVPGLMRAFPDESTLINRLSKEDLENALEFARDRMKKKVLGAKEALQGGVRQVVIADGRISSPISSAMAGNGTIISEL
jgi:[amino group carrier protein]-L-2-aminoadipate 6-kinase